MPRIPSAADVPTVGAGASRLATVRADAQDFGLTIGQGLGNLGEGLAELRPLAEDILRKEEQRQQAEEATDVATHGANMREAAGRSAADWQWDGSTPRQAAGKASKELTALSESQLKGLPPARQAAARQAVAGIAAAYGLHIAQRAQNAAVEALNRKADSALQLLQMQAVREPRAAVRYADEGSALLHSQREAGALTPEQFVARNEAFRRGLFAAVIQGQPAADAVADLEAGVYEEALEDAALKEFLLTQARWRLQSEQAQGRAAADTLVEGARRGIDSPALNARTTRLLAAGELADAELMAERARRARELLEPLRYAPEGVVREATARLGPASVDADAEERARLQAELHLQAEAMLRERRHDPAAYVMSQPAVAEAFAAAERDPALLGDAAAARLAAQAAVGFAREEQRALTRAESAEILTGLDALPPAERAVALGEIGRRYGDASGAVAAALVEAGLSPVEALLLDPADDPGPRGMLTQLIGRQSQGARPEVPEGDVIAETVERLIAAEPSAAVGAGTGGASGRNAPSLPLRKPERSSLPEEDEREADYQSLLRHDYKDLVDGLGPGEVAAVEEHVGRAARAAGARVGDEDLARRLAVHNLRAGFPLTEAVEEALHEAGIAVASGPTSRPNYGSVREKEREVRELLSLMTPAYPSHIQDADRALRWIGEVMAIRQVGAAERSAAKEALIERMRKALEKSPDRFLFPILRNAVRRAVRSPETAPWALTDAELVSVYQATGGSSEWLTEAALALMVPRLGVTDLLASAASLSAYQQFRMHKAYARELRRRGYLELPTE